MYTNKVVIRTTTEISYAGEIISEPTHDDNFIVLKPSSESLVLIFFPIQEIKYVLNAEGIQMSASKYIENYLIPRGDSI